MDCAVLVLTGLTPAFARIVGPFNSREDADAWIAEEELPTERNDGDWAVVLPWKVP